MPRLTSSAISGLIRSLLQWELPLRHKLPETSGDCLILLRTRGESTHVGILRRCTGSGEKSVSWSHGDRGSNLTTAPFQLKGFGASFL